MHSIAYQPADVIVGVDTHKDFHVTYAIDGLGRHIDDAMFRRPSTATHSYDDGRVSTAPSLSTASREPAPTATASPGSCDATTTG